MKGKLSLEETIRKAMAYQSEGLTDKALLCLCQGSGQRLSRGKITQALFEQILTTINSETSDSNQAYLPVVIDHLSKSAQQVLVRSHEIGSALATDHPLRDEILLLNSEISVLHHEINISMERSQFENSSGNKRLDTSSITKLNESWLEDISSRAVSQLGQDLWVLERCSYKRGGFFVEFGATNGILLSNTYLLETEFGWSGICAEPNPLFFDKLRQNRLCTVSDECIGPRSGETVEFVFADVYGGMLRDMDTDKHGATRQTYSKSGAVASLTTISLNDFLLEHKAPRTIDYLSIDTEGSEHSILATLPFDEWDIRHITVEHNHTPQRQLIRDLLSSYGYRCQEAQFDDWYFKT